MTQTIDISDSGRHLLDQLVRESNQDPMRIIEAALESYRRQLILADAATGYDMMATNQDTLQSWNLDQASLDSTVLDGLGELQG